jgi:hypothetical protein
VEVARDPVPVIVVLRVQQGIGNADLLEAEVQPDLLDDGFVGQVVSLYVGRRIYSRGCGCIFCGDWYNIAF